MMNITWVPVHLCYMCGRDQDIKYECGGPCIEGCLFVCMQDKDMVKLLLDMKERLDTVLNEAFGKAEAFGHALKDAFEHFINQRANRWAQHALPAVELTNPHSKGSGLIEIPLVPRLTGASAAVQGRRTKALLAQC